jgi:photosystem II stability/assembly factor-like uncharacterized protein
VKSDDRGASWSPIFKSSKSVETRALAIAPGQPRLLATGGDGGVRLSADGGKTWVPTGHGVAGLQQVESLSFDPTDRGTLYAGTWRQAFRTKDGGASWARIAQGMVLDATIYTWDLTPPTWRRPSPPALGLQDEDGGDR